MKPTLVAQAVQFYLSASAPALPADWASQMVASLTPEQLAKAIEAKPPTAH